MSVPYASEAERNDLVLDLDGFFVLDIFSLIRTAVITGLNYLKTLEPA